MLIKLRIQIACNIFENIPNNFIRPNNVVRKKQVLNSILKSNQKSVCKIQAVSWMRITETYKMRYQGNFTGDV